MPAPLPPGQRDRPDFPRFGLLPFATRFPSQTEPIDLQVSIPSIKRLHRFEFRHVRERLVH